MSIDLFGNDTNPVEKKPGTESILSRWTKKYNYRKSEEAEKCGNCEWSYYVEFSKKYYKCQLIGGSHSASTDIRINNVCDAYQKPKP